LSADDGELAVIQRQHESELRVAERRVAAAAQLVEALMNNGSAPEFEKTKARFELTSAEEALELAALRKRLFETHGRAKRLLEAQLESATLRLEAAQAEASTEAQRRAAEASIAAARANREMAEAQLRAAQMKLERCRVTAPRDGTLTYALASHASSSQIPVESGSSVREGQTLARIVDTQQLQVRVLVHETRISRIQIGQPAILRFDALPDVVFQGRVDRISSQPEAESWLGSGVKEYAVFVPLDNTDNRLRLGMTCTVEIDVSPTEPR
jgi:multidrug resistance efflux pump